MSESVWLERPRKPTRSAGSRSHGATREPPAPGSRCARRRRWTCPAAGPHRSRRAAPSRAKCLARSRAAARPECTRPGDRHRRHERPEPAAPPAPSTRADTSSTSACSSSFRDVRSLQQTRGATQLDLFGRRAQFWETWPTSGWMRHGSVYRLPLSAHPIPDTGSSSSPAVLFRTPLASDAARGGESLQTVKARRGTIALSHQIIDRTLHGPNGFPRTGEPETLWMLIGQLFEVTSRQVVDFPAGASAS